MVRHALQVTCENWTSYSAAQAESSREQAQDLETGDYRLEWTMR